jgi:GNAT superfamily N-acetyltransferase
MINIIRTDASHPDFIKLVKQLDAYLKITDGDEHDFYNQFNAIENLNHVVIVQKNKQPIGCGAFKKFNTSTVEIKRMFTIASERGNGTATKILTELENWAAELNFTSAILETGIRQTEAVGFYKKNLFQVVANYGQYIGVENSLCFEKRIK